MTCLHAADANLASTQRTQLSVSSSSFQRARSVCSLLANCNLTINKLHPFAASILPARLWACHLPFQHPALCAAATLQCSHPPHS